MSSEWSIHAGATGATFTRRGAHLRRLVHDDQDWVSVFDEGTTPVMMDGAQLAPWPGRVRDGKWTCQEQPQQLPITEPGRHNAIHGLAHAQLWERLDGGEDWLLLSTHLEEGPGWPGEMVLELTAHLASGRLDVRLEATNLSSGPLPFGYGAHPYLRLGGVPRSEWIVDLPFDQVLEVDERLLPVRLVAVGDPDLRGGRRLGATRLDHAFCSPARDGEGWWWVRLRHGDHALRLGSRDMGWVQVFTPEDAALLAVEPMSMAADALNGGPGSEGLVWLPPGGSVRHSWALVID